ncbi:uncharacterized protein LOC113369718 [Ctenocephalides felis]|uniref:uncharacterized protein LOC113369718 n=1 Tax=Ctenocephalides felis TaxID=7515 RepID=UPI000E6E5822|nr:uncharacterized protein LOC113369718 [Ctenocephalides felis]
MSDQYALCWNNYKKNLSSGFYSLYSKGDFTDVTLSADGQLIQAHRIVLAVCSPYFKNFFLKDISYKNLTDLIQFMYSGEVHVKQDDLPSFIAIAESLQIKGLTEFGVNDNETSSTTKNGENTSMSRSARANKRALRKELPEDDIPLKYRKRTSHTRSTRNSSKNDEDPLEDGASTSQMNYVAAKCEPVLEDSNMDDDHFDTGFDKDDDDNEIFENSNYLNTSNNTSTKEKQSDTPNTDSVTPKNITGINQTEFLNQFIILKTPLQLLINPVQIPEIETIAKNQAAINSEKENEASNNSKDKPKSDKETEEEMIISNEEIEDVLVYTLSTHGYPQLIHQGHCFQRYKNANGRAYWKCKQSRQLGCKARLITEPLAQTSGSKPSTKITVTSKYHNHGKIKDFWGSRSKPRSKFSKEMEREIREEQELQDELSEKQNKSETNTNSKENTTAPTNKSVETPNPNDISKNNDDSVNKEATNPNLSDSGLNNLQNQFEEVSQRSNDYEDIDMSIVDLEYYD